MTLDVVGVVLDGFPVVGGAIGGGVLEVRREHAAVDHVRAGDGRAVVAQDGHVLWGKRI